MIFVFLPAYNEETAVESLVKKFDVELKNKGPYRIVVLDDGSTDKTARVAQDMSKQYPVQLLKHEKNQGLGQTMIDGLKYCAQQAAADDLIVTLDCDDTHEPKYVHSAIGKINEGYDVVILSRYQQGGGEEGLSGVKSFLSRGAGFFLKLFFPIQGVKEYSCGYRVFRASALKRAFEIFGEKFIEFPNKGFVVTPEILVKLRMMHCRIAEVPFVLRYDMKAGQSKNRPFRTIGGYFALVSRCWGKNLRDFESK